MERMPRGLSHLALVGETSRVGGGNVAKVIDTALAKGGYPGRPYNLEAIPAKENQTKAAKTGRRGLRLPDAGTARACYRQWGCRRWRSRPEEFGVRIGLQAAV